MTISRRFISFEEAAASRSRAWRLRRRIRQCNALTHGPSPDSRGTEPLGGRRSAVVTLQSGGEVLPAPATFARLPDLDGVWWELSPDDAGNAREDRARCVAGAWLSWVVLDRRDCCGLAGGDEGASENGGRSGPASGGRGRAVDTDHALDQGACGQQHRHSRCARLRSELIPRYPRARRLAEYAIRSAPAFVLPVHNQFLVRLCSYTFSVATSGGCSFFRIKSTERVQFGIHQFARPSRRISAGTSRARITVASKMIPAASPIANGLIS